jgi:hypothetical protein
LPIAAGGVVLAQHAILQGVITAIEALTGDQSSGLSSAQFEFNSKDTARENLREMLSEISRTARSMVYEFPGIDLKFRMLRGDSDANLLAKARAFLSDATPHEADFVRYEMDAKFLETLQNLINDFENALEAPGTATDSHVAATAEIGTKIREGMIAVRTMNAPVKNKYRSNAGKLAAWMSASHVEKVSADKEPTPPTP